MYVSLCVFVCAHVYECLQGAKQTPLVFNKVEHFLDVLWMEQI